jgi:hypothetical protein
MALSGGRTTMLRLAVTAVGVGVGVTLLLIALAGQSAMQGRAERSGWHSADDTTAAAAAADDPALFLSVADYHHGDTLRRAYVAALGPRPPVPPGLDELPGPGEMAVSPAMQRLLERTPDDRLDDRFPGRIVATIGDAGLASPDEEVALIGRTPEQLGAVRSDELETVRGFDVLPADYAFLVGLRFLLGVVTALLLVPVVVFIVMATRVAAAHRQQRLAALRLAGATRRQTATIAAVETGLAAAAGSVLGYLGYEIGRRLVAATATFQGDHFHVDDAVVAPRLLAVVLVGMPILAMVVTVATLGRVQAGPLATTRQAYGRLPSPWRALPFVAGVAGQWALAIDPLADALGDGLVDRLAPLLVIATMVGFVALGPWVCLLAGRLLARTTRSLPGLIAARRVAADPHATFRVVGGVVLAAFAVTYAASLTGPATRSESTTGGSGDRTLLAGTVEVIAGGADIETVAPLLAAHPDAVVAFADPGGGGELVGSCRDLARMVTVRCAAGAFVPDGDVTVHERDGLEGRTDLAVRAVYVPTDPADDSPAAEDRVRTEAAELVPNAIIHARGDQPDPDVDFLTSVGQILRLGWCFVMIVAACSLAVGMVAGIVERRRPFALLRASGLRPGELRRVVLLETAAAMVLTATAGVVLGMGASLALARLGDLGWAWPDAGSLGLVGVAVVAALALSTLVLPLLDVATRHDAVRYE